MCGAEQAQLLVVTAFHRLLRSVQPVPVYEVYTPPIVMKTHRGHAAEGMDWEGEITLLVKT